MRVRAIQCSAYAIILQSPTVHLAPMARAKAERVRRERVALAVQAEWPVPAEWVAQAEQPVLAAKVARAVTQAKAARLALAEQPAKVEQVAAARYHRPSMAAVAIARFRAMTRQCAT
jgi:hypothetical protein